MKNVRLGLRDRVGNVSIFSCDRSVMRDLPGVVSERKGPYRSRSMPLLATSTDTVTWQCVGDDARIMAILHGVAAIGKKRSQGEGRVLRWE